MKLTLCTPLGRRLHMQSLTRERPTDGLMSISSTDGRIELLLSSDEIDDFARAGGPHIDSDIPSEEVFGAILSHLHTEGLLRILNANT